MNRIALGSTSEIKLNAVKEVFPHYEITTISCKSGVPSQPVGKEQTQCGARNRSRAALDSVGGDCEFAVGIENGMWEEKDENGVRRLVDGGVCCSC